VLLDDTVTALYNYVAFYLSLLGLIAVPVLFLLFGGLLIQYTFRLIRRRFEQGKV
jgi:hypothetical protein